MKKDLKLKKLNLTNHCLKKKTKKVIGIMRDELGLEAMKELFAILTELFIRGKELNISVVFITQSCFAILENIK